MIALVTVKSLKEKHLQDTMRYTLRWITILYGSYRSSMSIDSESLEVQYKPKDYALAVVTHTVNGYCIIINTGVTAFVVEVEIHQVIEWLLSVVITVRSTATNLQYILVVAVDIIL